MSKPKDNHRFATTLILVKKKFEGTHGKNS